MNSYQQAEDKTASERIMEKAQEALVFCKANAYNTDFCVLVDMKIHSGRYRLFVYRFHPQKVEWKSLCAHGRGRGEQRSAEAQPIFSNAPGSWLSSLGKYEIDVRAPSQWGVRMHYKLHGLEESNSNALSRYIVLHSHSSIPSRELFPQHLPMEWSRGCPVVDDDTMLYLDDRLKDVNRPVLLWIFD